ncbi:hypothetical protein H4582DRAFT_2072083 [Lactarius indigo]|nr:hypothetical protein H4582DRAFT_2072083 [Lactarius indigo]
MAAVSDSSIARHSSPIRKSQKEILGPPPSLQLAAPTIGASEEFHYIFPTISYATALPDRGQLANIAKAKNTNLTGVSSVVQEWSPKSSPPPKQTNAFDRQ